MSLAVGRKAPAARLLGKNNDINLLSFFCKHAMSISDSASHGHVKDGTNFAA